MTRSVAVASVIAGVIGCSDSTGLRPLENSIGVIVSAPVSPTFGVAAAAGRAFEAASRGLQVVYVSLQPQSVPTGVSATTTDRASGRSTTTSIVNGGFDPVPIVASVGDTLVVEITGSGPPVQAELAVAPVRPLKIVRTSPPSGGRDVPLNAAIAIVFSEPIDSAALSDGSIELLQDTTPVPGTFRFGDASQLRVEFHPASLLASQTAYQLQASTAIRSVNGAALDSPFDMQFTTGASGTAGAASLALSGLPCNIVVTAKDASGSVVTSYAGTVHFTATDPTAVLPPDYTFVSADGGTHTFPVTLKTAGMHSVTATDLAHSLSGSAAVTLDPTVPDKPLYVTNEDSHSVTVYAAGASCNATPTATIVGNNTGLNDPDGIALDATGRVYVANPNNVGPQSINIYASGASGNVAPVAAITDSGPGFVLDPAGIVLDGQSRLYVASATLLLYAAGATGNTDAMTGNVVPIAGLSGCGTAPGGTCPLGPTGITLDAAGQLYVSYWYENMVLVFPAGAMDTAMVTRKDVPAIAAIVGGNTGLNEPVGIAVDNAGRLYVANAGDDSITIYAAGATGDATPIATIAGSNTGLDWPRGIALDGAGRLYVANGGSSSITVYAAGATGDATPIATIAGNNTGLHKPGMLAFPIASAAAGARRSRR